MKRLHRMPRLNAGSKVHFPATYRASGFEAGAMILMVACVIISMFAIGPI